MNLVAQISEELETASLLRDAFMRWQCRVRQIAMRENLGRPDDASTPTVCLPCALDPLGKIITVLCKSPAYSKTPELRHIYQHTNEPAQRRDKALQLLAESYYQKHAEFSNMLTATFAPKSEMATALEKAAVCQLTFSAYGQRFELVCVVKRLGKSNPHYLATWWHNLLFNPNLNPGTIILGFAPDWEISSAEPPINNTR
ncbi:MAG: hypothetical protein VCE75_10510 [Alphaproteobacteria bacterium]